jgi:hypothetical protein
MYFFFCTTPFIICVVPPLEAYRLIMTPLIIFNLYVTTPAYITIIHIILQVGGSVRGIAHCPGLHREDLWPFTSRRSLLVSVVWHRRLRHRPKKKKTAQLLFKSEQPYTTAILSIQLLTILNTHQHAITHFLKNSQLNMTTTNTVNNAAVWINHQPLPITNTRFFLSCHGSSIDTNHHNHPTTPVRWSKSTNRSAWKKPYIFGPTHDASKEVMMLLC